MTTGPSAGQSVNVRRVHERDDLAAAGAIVQQAYFALPDYPRDPYYDATLGDVAARAHEAVVVVAFIGNRLVGCLTYVPDHHNPHAEFDDAKAAGFRYFGVDPSVQGKGVGEAMVRWCIHEAKRTGHRRLRIHTLASMPAAQRLYERIGFERDPAHDEDWDGIAGLAFVLHL
jgi:GNAT superfamily N-acetyltransferase